MYTQDEAIAFLKASQILFDDEDFPGKLILNLNDTFYWACAECEEVPEECAIEVATLLFRYGWCGVLYWVHQRRGGFTPEFLDVRRFIEFVQQEETLRKNVPDSSARAYTPLTYQVGMAAKE